MRRTKILATLGPATDEPGMMDKLVEAGVDVVRINFSHGSVEEHEGRVNSIREAARKQGRVVGVLVDLQGPKIRIDRFKDKKIELKEGDRFILDANHPEDEGNQERVGLAYKALPEDVSEGDTLLLDDGRIVLWVDEVHGAQVICRVVHGGALSDKKGINLQGGGLSAPALTEKDRRDIITAAKLQADYMAVSFPRKASDLIEARQLLKEAGGNAGIVAKIERAEALHVLDEIIEASDAVMVARGDLGVEIGDAELPAVQKHLIKRARELNRVVITATQMMESMIYNPIPTRAEVFDVANAVLDGTDAVMLSAETAAGKYPDKAISAMDRICREAEKQFEVRTSDHRINTQFSRIDEAIAMAAMYTANHLDVKCIAALTESGATPLWMSRISSGRPIYALSTHEETCRKVTLFRGVYPLLFQINTTDHAELNKVAMMELEKRGAVNDADLVIITKGDLVGVRGGANALKVVKVGDLAATVDS
ncbi:MAG: pyruvate kinase [Gammaproteobacteria bacterium]|nr:pyruvate kinase [Gammaproteobacteria bacterium]MDH5693055.1 pyruvate kinase [Gammaproteobacteria bacterium]